MLVICIWIPVVNMLDVGSCTMMSVVLHGIPLEEGYVRVQFEVAEKSEFNTPLPKPCDDANLIGEAPGYFLAWPRKLVSMELEVIYVIYICFYV